MKHFIENYAGDRVTAVTDEKHDSVYVELMEQGSCFGVYMSLAKIRGLCQEILDDTADKDVSKFQFQFVNGALSRGGVLFSKTYADPNNHLKAISRLQGNIDYSSSRIAFHKAAIEFLKEHKKEVELDKERAEVLKEHGFGRDYSGLQPTEQRLVDTIVKLKQKK